MKINRRMRYGKFWTLFSISLASCLASTTALPGCTAPETEQSPTPQPGNVESYEDLRWEGWLDYEDADVELHVLTFFELFASRDGLFCGRYMGYWGYPGAYLAVNTGTTWVVVVDVPEGTYEGWGTQGRTYGTVSAELELTGWLDATKQSEWDAIDPTVEPEMVASEVFFEAHIDPSASLSFNILPLTFGELVEYATREGSTTSSSDPSVALPMDLPIDLPEYYLEFTGPTHDGAEEADAQLCTWCNEAQAKDTPNSVSLPGSPARSATSQP